MALIHCHVVGPLATGCMVSHVQIAVSVEPLNISMIGLDGSFNHGARGKHWRDGLLNGTLTHGRL